jgi:hypothetical protein
MLRGCYPPGVIGTVKPATSENLQCENLPSCSAIGALNDSREGAVKLESASRGRC